MTRRSIATGNRCRISPIKRLLQTFTRRLGASWALALTPLAFSDESAEPTASFDETLLPMMERYCFDCHNPDKAKGDIDLTGFASSEQMQTDRGLWRLAMDLIELEEMPNEGPFPSAEEREGMIGWIDSVVNDRDWEKNPHPGYVTIPRLNKTEYNNTMRDLIGIDLRPGDFFLEDGEGQSGFDNDRSALFVTPSLLDNYFQAAENALSSVRFLREGDPISLHWESEDMFMTETKSVPLPFPNEDGPGGYDLNRGQMTLYESADLPSDGYYRFRIRARRRGGPVGAILRIDDVAMGDLRIESTETEIYEIVALVKGGTRQVAWNHNTVFPIAEKKGSVHIDWVEIEGPILKEGTALRVFEGQPEDGKRERFVASKSIRELGSRAFRRPMARGEVRKYMTLYDRVRKEGGDFNDAIQEAYTGIFVSPQFFYRTEQLSKRQPKRDQAFRVDPYAFISRLSYFLWLSMPDDELFALAESKRIFEPEVLRSQVDRMLRDERSRAFSELFLGQWLGFSPLGKSFLPDSRSFPEYTFTLNRALKKEPVLLLESLLQEGGSLLELLASDRTFVNAELAAHYGIGGVTGDAMREVKLEDEKRGGLVAMASVLTATSTPVRTSPVLRGVWVLETLLGQRVPPPPPNAGDLPANAGNNKAKTLREELVQHREQEACASCHERIDPIGFGLENYDAIGRYREREGKLPIDSLGVMPDGSSFNGPVEFKRYLMTHRRDDFARNVIERMLSFALGRELGVYDQPAVKQIFDSLESDDFEAIRLVEEIVSSFPFQYHTDQPLDSI